MALRWQQAEGRRHALDSPKEPEPEVPFTALCGQTVSPGQGDFVALGGLWLDPTCWLCDRVWRERADFPDNEIPELPTWAKDNP